MPANDLREKGEVSGLEPCEGRVKVDALSAAVGRISGEERLVSLLWDTRKLGHRLGGALAPTACLVKPDLQDTVGSWKGPWTRNSVLLEWSFLTSKIRTFWGEISGDVSSICLSPFNTPAEKGRI